MSCEGKDLNGMPRYEFKVHFWFHSINAALASKEQRKIIDINDPELKELRVLADKYSERFSSSLPAEFRDDITRGHHAFYIDRAIKEGLGEQR